MTHVRGLKARTERKDVITDEEFREMLLEAQKISETFYRLRTLALLCVLRLTGKRRSEISRLEVSDLKIEDPYLHITFTLSKKRKQTVITKSILHVKKVLGHKSIMTTQRYVELYTEIYGDLKPENYICEVASSVKEAQKLLEAGFEYVCEIEGEKLFRKVK